ncbi:MAG TPA: pitrilysin family protein [Candidatus Acidoferrales bacterium]|jgi:zinc protease|nr:pitrilysin family protein [Candidatus Acidoferrales bacterium]
MNSAPRSRLLILCLGIAVAAVNVFSQDTAKETPPAKAPANAAAPSANRSAEIALPEIKFEKYTLPNGLVVILSEDHRLPLVSTNIWYHVGPANELPGRTGFAHLFEHMMFEGSKHVPGNSHIRYLEAAGASDFNGTTDFDRTNYFETIPSNRLELALWLESDRMGYLPDKLDQASLSNQQDVVRNERRQSIENSPYGIVEEGVFHMLFPKNHPYHADVMGSHADIQAAKLEDVRNFFKLYYAPNNASLAIVGDFDSAQAKQFVEKYFGPLKRGAPVPKIAAVTPPITSERRAVIHDQVELPRVYMAWLTSPIFKPGDAAADLAAEILGGGKSSRLYKKLIYEKQIALDVSASQQSLILGSIFEIVVTARPGHTADEMEKAVDAELDTFRKDGPTSVELERARNGTETEMIQGLERLGGFGGVADRLNEYNHYLGKPGYFPEDVHRYQVATPDSIRAFAQTQLKPTARVVVYGIPGKPDLGPDVPTPKNLQKGQSTGGESVNADAAWREDPPNPGPTHEMNLPVPDIFNLSNGLTVYYHYRAGLPVVAANVVFNTGSGANPVTKPGLASFTANMLQQGTQARNAMQIADEAALLGTELSSSANMDSSTVGASALTTNFPGVLDLISDIVLHPTFPPDEVERRRQSRLAAFTDERSDPDTILARTGVSALFGPRNPFGYDSAGTEPSIQAMTREDMMNFWRTNYVPNNAALVVSGNIPVDELKALAENKFGGWKSGEFQVPQVGAPETTKAKIIIVDRPGAQQTMVRLLQLGVNRATPDYPALEVMNSELGGLFSSRINLNLREEHGYTYGAASFFVYRRSVGYFGAGGGIRTDATAPAVTEILKEIHRMIDTPMKPEELSLAKDSQSRSLPGIFETNSGEAGALSELFVYNLARDYFSKLPDRLNAVTAEGAEAVAKKYLHPEQLILVCVGDRAKIEPELVKLDLGAIEIRDADGNVVK